MKPFITGIKLSDRTPTSSAVPDGGLLLQLTQRHHLVHEAHLHGLLSIVQTGQEPHLFGSFRAHQARHHRAAVAGVKAAHLKRTTGAHLGVANPLTKA